MNYRFGKSTKIPHSYTHKDRPIISRTPYDTIRSNPDVGMHTLVLLDIDPMVKGYITINRDCELLMEVDSHQDEPDLKQRLAVGVARAGSPSPVVVARPLVELAHYDFVGPLHILVVPADLHFIEAEALVKLAAAPEKILDNIK